MRWIEKETSVSLSICVGVGFEMMVGGSREVCSRPMDKDGRGGSRVFSQRRRRSQDSRAANCEDERNGRGRDMVEIVYPCQLHLCYFLQFSG